MRRLRGWPTRAGLVVAALAVLTVAGWFLLPRLSLKSPEARGAPIVATFSQLSDQSGSEVFPSLSPDVKQIVYASKQGDNWDIYLQRDLQPSSDGVRSMLEEIHGSSDLRWPAGSTQRFVQTSLTERGSSAPTVSI